MDALICGWADRELGAALEGAQALLALAGLKGDDGAIAEAIDGQPGGVLSLGRLYDESGRAALIASLIELGMGRVPAQKVASALQRARREGQPIVRRGERPTSSDVVPLPEGWHARVFILSDVHVDHDENRRWLMKATAKVAADRPPMTVDVLMCCGDLCEDLEDLREVLVELRKHFDHVVFTPGNHDLWVRRGKHTDSVDKLKAVLAMCADIRVRCSPLWLRAAVAPDQGTAATATARAPPAASAGRLSYTRLLELQEECLADDVPIPEGACGWSEDEARAFFESGGQEVPATSAAPPPVPPPPAAEDLLLVPLFSWYEYAWDAEPDLDGQQPTSDLKMASDFQYCRWPTPELRDFDAYADEPPTGALAGYMARLNRSVLARMAVNAPLDPAVTGRPPPTRRLSGKSTFRLYHDGALPPKERYLHEVNLSTFCTRRTDGKARSWTKSFEEDVGVDPSTPAAPAERRRPGGPYVISCSHFLPRQELLPEKRLLRFPSLAKISGSRTLAEQVDELGPDCHVFGHTHLPWDMTVGGVRYVQWPLGNPKERADPSSITGTRAVGDFMKVYDGRNGGEAPEHFTTFCAHYAEFERDLSKKDKAPQRLPSVPNPR